jgi:hypothetical protein
VDVSTVTKNDHERISYRGPANTIFLTRTCAGFAFADSGSIGQARTAGAPWSWIQSPGSCSEEGGATAPQNAPACIPSLFSALKWDFTRISPHAVPEPMAGLTNAGKAGDQPTVRILLNDFHLHDYARTCVPKSAQRAPDAGRSIRPRNQ